MADLKDVIDKLQNEGNLVRNKGAHSIKSVKEILLSNQVSPAQKKQEAEDAKNAAAASNTLLSEIANGIGGSSAAGKDAKKSGKLGGMLGGLGAVMGSMGIGVGVAMGGLGALFAGGGYLLKQLAEFDGKAVVANVRELFKIADLSDGIGDAFVKGGSFLVSMFGLGVGLAFFGVGSSIAGLGGALTNFIDPKWAQSIVDNVVILLGLSDAAGGVGTLLSKGGAFTASMMGIGIGLGFFGAGAAVAGLAGALTNFVDPNWAQGIVDNVVILLGLSKAVGGIGTLLQEGGAFFLAMTGIGLGLAVFGIGSAAAGLAQFVVKEDWAQTIVDSVTKLLGINKLIPKDSSALEEGGAFVTIMGGIALGLIAFTIGSAANSMATALGQFSGAGANFADDIVYNVTKLMEISNLSFGDVAKFTGFMTAIAAGLVAFAVGKGANNMGDVIGKFTGNFADNIVKDVKTLLGMLDEEGINQKKANTFSSVMGTIAGGLTKFGAGSFVGSLANAAGAALSFLTGTKSPVVQMQQIADDAENLEKGAQAIGKISANLDKIGSLKFDGSDLSIKKFAEDLLESIPDIEVAIKGGKVSTGVFSGTVIKGLGSKDIPWDTAGKNLAIINNALNSNSQSSGGAIEKGGSGDSLKLSIDALTAQIAAMPAGGAPINAPTNITRAGDVHVAATNVNPRAALNGNSMAGAG